MVEYAAISVISPVLGFVLGYAVRAAISARRRRKASRYDARQSWAGCAPPALIAPEPPVAGGDPHGDLPRMNGLVRP